MKHLTFFLFLVLMPYAMAFDCSSLESSLQDDCSYLENVDESLIAGLLISDSFTPDHTFISDYNRDISVSKPDDVISYSQGAIQNAWLSILRVQPSVLYEDKLYGGSFFTIYSDYDYAVNVPPTYTNNRKSNGAICKIYYSLDRNTATFTYDLGKLETHNPVSSFSIGNTATVEARLDIDVRIKQKEYEWDRYCCRRNSEGRCTRRCYDCDYDRTQYSHSSLTVYDYLTIYPYQTNTTSFIVQNEYGNTVKGELFPYNNFILDIGNASYLEQNIKFGGIFTQPPNYFIQLTAENTSFSRIDRINTQGNTLLATKSADCSITQSDFFRTSTIGCIDNTSKLDISPFEKREFSSSWKLFLLLVVIAFVSYLVYRIVKSTWGKYIPIFILPVLLIPSAFASECGLTNLGACLPESIFNFFNDLINSPIQPMITATRFLMEEPVVVDPFFGIWQIILYIMGFFYLLMFTFVGFSFLTSGHDVIKREQSKEWLKNTFLVIIFTSASFYLYELVLDLSAVLTSSFLSTVPEEFFLLTIDNISNVALQFFSSLSYLLVLGITILALALRYIITAIGVIFVPIGLLCYFIPPLKSYGNFMLQLLGISIFIPVVNALVIIACSQLLTVGIFAHVKILVMICCFFIVDLVMIFAIWHIITKTGLADAGQTIASAGKYIAALI